MEHVTEKSAISTPEVAAEPTDYATILDSYGLKYQPVDCYYQVGEITPVQGWILHLSVIQFQIRDLLLTILPELITENISFKVVQSESIAVKLLEGNLGYAQLAKIVNIYPESNEKAVLIAKKIIPLTSTFRGPAIPSDVHLGGTVYTRYGSFNPVIQHDIAGRATKYIYNAQGQLVKDEYWFPFRMPAGVSWPFADILPFTPLRNKVLLNNRYKIMYLLKGDVKGNVMKALRRKGFWFQWCVVKEGKKNMWPNPEGLDMGDRVTWQHTLQSALGNEIAVPKAYDLFVEDGNTYFVMQFVKGRSLENEVLGIYKKSGCWSQLALSDQLLLTDWLMQIIVMVEKMHQLGYVHRDVTLGNFLISKKNKVYTIDMELAYALQEEPGKPPFTLGTPGFMSPEQFARQIPTVKEDIYALGALMTSFFTGFRPLKFKIKSGERMEEHLGFFIPNPEIVKLIVQSVSDDPHDRPELSAIKKAVQRHADQLVRTGQSPAFTGHTKKPDRSIIKEIVSGYQQALNSLVTGEKIWYSNLMQGVNIFQTAESELAVYPGLHTGISGALYLVSLMKQSGLSVDTVMETAQKNYDYLQNEFLASLANVPPGMFHGAAGIAVALASWLENGLAEPSDQVMTFLQQCFELPAAGLDLANGVSGQGLALLQCAPFLPGDVVRERLSAYAGALINNQQKDGSWTAQETAGKNPLKLTGFSYGVAGMACFLLEYYRRYNNEQARTAAIKALLWLKKTAQKKEGRYTWKFHDKDKESTSGIENGFAGIALCFIRAYEILGDPAYKQMAEGALYNNPKYLTKDTFIMSRGVCGTGQVYLEAYRVLKDNEWLERADWITQVFIHTANHEPDGSCTWQVEGNKLITADLLTGNSGVAHFLLRYLMPECIGIPLLPLRSTG